MIRLKGSIGFSVLAALLMLVIVGILGFTGWFVYHSQKTADKSYDSESSTHTDSTKNQTTANDEYAGWKTYESTDKSLSFKYPGDWFIREDSSLKRIYISTDSTAVTRDNIPAGFQQVWIAVGSDEASVENENSIKAGNPKGVSVNGEIAASTIKSGELAITIYEYDTVGGKVLQAFWSGKSGTRYYATNATEVGQTNQQNMVNNLKKILATIKVQ
jgi:hypothetical protein